MIRLSKISIYCWFCCKEFNLFCIIFII